MTILRRFLVAAFGVVAVAAMLVPPIARADDYKVLPGALCQRESQTTYGNGSASSWSLWGAAYLNGNADTVNGYDHVICPIVRDQIQNTNGLKKIQVRIYNAGTGRGFHCDLWSLSQYGGAGTVSGFPSFPNPLQTVTATATVTGLSTLTIATTTSTVSGYYALHCEVPPNSLIYSYQSREVPDTNAN